MVATEIANMRQGERTDLVAPVIENDGNF
jgi:hypothetical protein